MCPLRVLLIFLSATIAGFFVIRSLRSQPEFGLDDSSELEPKEQLPIGTKVGLAMKSGFWTCVDMASGKYLWRIMMANGNGKQE